MEKHFDGINNVLSDSQHNNMNNAESCTFESAALVSHTEEEICLLCKGDEVQEAACFACFDIAMPDEESKNGVKSFTIEAPCCKECRRSYQIIKYIPPLISAFICIIVIAALTVRGVFEFLASKFFALPIVVMLVMFALSLLLAELAKKMFIRKFSNGTHMNVFDIEEYAHLEELGAVELDATANMSQPVFSNEHLSKYKLKKDKSY